MTYRSTFLFCFAIVSSYPPLTFGGALVQKPDLVLPANATAYQTVIKDIFVTSYQAYIDYAWSHDDLLPVTESYVDDLNGWGASIADAMDTMWLMGLTEWFEQAVNFTGTIDFNVSYTPDTVDIFETTIRWIAGYLSAYELSGYQYPILIQKAQELTNKMTYAWVGDNAIPYGYLNFTNDEPTITTSNIAEAGTLTMEFGRLSNYTGNDTYRALAEKSVLYIASLADPLPGLAAQGIDPTSGQFVGDYVTWGGGSDSYFEYLIKYARLTNTDDETYANTWRTAVDSSIRDLIRTSTVGNWTYLADYDEGEYLHVGSHLECFVGGNWILGGKLTNNDTIVDYGLKLVDACWNTYASTATGIGPETFAYISSDGSYTGSSGPSTLQQEFYDLHGFYITTADYIQRPEVLESNFYAWRVSGDVKYLENAASAIASFQKYLYLPGTSTGGVAYAGINNVDSTHAQFENEMQSFWFAEVLKYLWLTFDDPNNISLDDYVFNTECHPLKAPPALDTYGTGIIEGDSQPFSASSGSLPAVSPVAVSVVPVTTS